MKFLAQGIAGVFLIKPESYIDGRGLLRRHFCPREFEAQGISFDVKQCNVSENRCRHTLRGFHYQVPPHTEAKVLSCFRGSIYDIVVDLRPASGTYLKWINVELSDENRLSLYVPPGCANAWLTLQDDTWIFYYHSEFYHPESERGLRFNDPLFSFEWPVQPAVVSKKDLNHPDYVPVI